MTSRPTAPRIAIVDDEIDIVTYLTLALEDRGFRVVAINDASTAIQRLEESRPDLICLDLLMPKQSGLSLYKELTTHPDLASCPVVMTSGLTPSQELPSLLEHAGHLPPPAAFVEKPIALEQFLEVVTRVIGRPAEAMP